MKRRNNFDGTANGDPTLTTDAERGDVLTFDGDDRIDVANSVSTLGDQVTIAAWVNLDAGQQDNVFLSIGDEFYIILDNSSPSLSMGLRVSNFTTNSLNADHNIAGEGWNHVAATFNDITKETYLYLSGELVRSSTFSFGDVDWSAPTSPNITIGSLSDGSSAFTGSLDDIRVYNSELSQTDLIAVMGDNGFDSETVNLTVNAVNDAPVVTAPGSVYSFTEQGTLNIHGTGFTLADVDDNGGTLTATFSVGEGRILVDVGDSGASVASGSNLTSGNGTDSVEITGTKAQINALLSGSSTGTIVFYHDQTVASDTPSASTTITLTVNDQGNTGSDPGNTGDGSSEEHSASQTINITSVNDSPEFLGPELITNGDFATNDLTGWTTTGQTDFNAGGIRFGEANVAGPHTASQTISTTAGETYLLTFDYRDGRGDFNQSLQVTVDGSSNLLTTSHIVTDVEGNTYVRYQYSFTADSNSSTITFSDTSDSAGLSNNTQTTDGHLDNISVRQTGGQLGTAAFSEGGSAVVLDSDITLFDAEIVAALDDYDGTTLTLNRNGGANSDDVFSGSGNLVLNAGTLELSSTNIGSYTNTGGQLSITFNGTPNTAQINEVLQSIAYSNTNQNPLASVQINWTFNDNNDGSQGSGSAQDATGHTIVNITATNDAPTNAGSLPSDVSVTEDVPTSIDLSPIDFSDVDAASSDLTVTLSTSTGGELTLAADASIDFGGTATARTLTGTLAELNAYFNNGSNIQYLHGTQHTFGDNADTITVVINDNGNTGSGGGTDQNFGTVNVDITAVNDEEVLATLTGTTVSEGSTGTVITTAMLHTTDVDNTDAQLVYTVDTIPINGTLRLSGSALSNGQTFTQADIDAGNVTYDHNGSQTSADSLDFTVDDGAGTTTSATFNFTVTNVNDAPVISDLAGDTLNYTEGDGLVRLDQSVVGNLTVTDVDSADFDTGTLTVSFVSGSDSAEDALAIIHTGTGVGEIGVAGNTVTYEGGTIGTFTGGTGGSDLVVTLNSFADEEATRALLLAIGYENTDTDNPTTGARTVRFVLTDGDGGTSANNDVTVNVSRVNDTPSVTGPGSAYSATEQTNLNIHGSGFSVTDVDVTSGTMTATLVAGEGDIALTAGDSGVTIGSNSASTVSFTGSLAQINNLLTGIGTGTIVYNNGSDTPSALTTITLTVNDGGNTGADPGLTADGSSEEDSASQTINLTAINDDPTNAGTLPSDVTVAEDVLTSVDLSAVDFSDVDAGSSDLTVTLSTSTGGQLTLAADASIDFGGTATARTLAGTIAELNAYFNNTSNIQYLHGTTHTFGNDADTITVVINDGGNTGSGGGTDQTLGTVNVDITAINDEEVLTANTGTTVAEGSTVNTITTAMLESTDVDNTDAQLVYTVDAVTINGTLRLSGSALSNGQTFTQADIDAGNVTYDHDGSQTSADSFDFTVDDGAGTTTSATFNFTVTNVNDAPVNAVPGAQSVDEDTSINISGISVADDDDNLSTVQLTVNDGTLNVTLSGSASISAGSNGSNNLTLSGSLADINTTLASLTYQGNANFNGSDTLTVLSTDSNAATDSDTVTITVNAVNDTPTVTGPGSAYAVNEQTNLNIHGTGFGVTDVDAASGTMTATFVVGEGDIALAAGDSGVSITANNASTVTFTGTLAQINNFLTGVGTGTIVYNNGSDTPSALTTITLTVNDGGNTGADPGLTANGSSEEDSASQTINLTAVNDDPTNAGTLPSDVTVAEDVLTSVDLSAVDFSDVDAGSSDLTVTLSTSTGGQLTLAADASIDFGGTATARTLTGTLTELNTYFGITTNVQYLHSTTNLNGDNADTITVVINDNGNTGTGGGSNQMLGVVNVDITALNDSSSVTLSGGVAYTENDPPTLVAPTAVVADVDSANFDGGSLTVQYTAGGDTNDRLDIRRVGDGVGEVNVVGANVRYEGVTIGTVSGGVGASPLVITLNANADAVSTQAVLQNITYEHLSNAPNPSRSFDVTLTDGDGGTVTASETIVITAVNDSPTMTALGGDSIFPTNDGTVLSLDPGAVAGIADPDGPADFDGGSLQVTGLGFDVVDLLRIDTSGTVTLSAGFANGSVVSVSGTAVGTLSGVSDSGATISLNANATVGRVESLLQSFTFQSTSAVLGTRTVDFTLNDGDGTANGGSDTAVATVNVLVASTGDGTVTTNEDTAYTFVATDFDFTGTTGGNLSSITVTALPGSGTLLLGGVAVSVNDTITKAQIDAGQLTFEAVTHENGVPYTTFDFAVNGGMQRRPCWPGSRTALRWAADRCCRRTQFWPTVRTLVPAARWTAVFPCSGRVRTLTPLISRPARSTFTVMSRTAA